MILHLIPYKEGILWVDKTTECKIGELLYLNDIGLYGSPDAVVNYGRQQNTGEGFKVVAQTKLYLSNIPYIEIEEENVVTKAREGWKKSEAIMKKMGEVPSLGDQAFFVSGYTFGYKAASAKKYTEEDLRISYMKGAIDGQNNLHPLELFEKRDKYIRSIQPRPVSVEIETNSIQTTKKEDYEYLGNNQSNLNYIDVPVTYTKDGKTFLKVKKFNYD